MAVVGWVLAAILVLYVGGFVLQSGWELTKIVRASFAPGRSRPILLIGTPAIAAALWVIAKQRGGPVGLGIGVICLLCGWMLSLMIAALAERSSGNDR